MEIPLEVVAFIGIIFALLARTVLPYLKKVHEDPNTYFDYSYIGTMIIGGIASAVFIYPLFVFSDVTQSPLTIFIAAFLFAWSANDVTNRLTK